MLLPHIHVNRLATGIHMSPPNWISLPRPSPPQPSTWPQSTSPGWPASCSILALVIYSAYGNIHASVPFSQTIHPTLAFSHRIQMDLEPFIESQVSQKCNGTPLQYSCLENPMDGGAWWAAVHGVAKSRMQLSDFTFTFHFHALVKEMATHSSVLAWRIPGTGEPGGLLSMGSHRVGHDWGDLAAAPSQKEKDTQPILTHTYGICKDGTEDPTYRVAKETKMETAHFFPSLSHTSVQVNPEIRRVAKSFQASTGFAAKCVNHFLFPFSESKNFSIAFFFEHAVLFSILLKMKCEFLNTIVRRTKAICTENLFQGSYV